MEKTHSPYGVRIALLIDFDNVVLGVDDPPGFDVELVVNALRSRGSVVLGRAYGDWYRHHRHRRKLMEQGIELVETPVFGPLIKNSADIRIVLDGFEIATQQSHIDTFCMVSGDSDFLPLIKKLQYLGKQVIVIAGTKFTSELIRRNCNEYISYENLLAESVGADEDATTLNGAFQLLQRTIANLSERGVEVRSSTVKQMMVQLNPVFSERNFGCSQFKQFLDKGVAANFIKLGQRDTSSGEYLVFLDEDNVVVVSESSNGVSSSGNASNGASSSRSSPSRRRTSRTRKSKEEESNAAQPEEAQSTPVAASTSEEESSDEAKAGESKDETAARGPLRRGRLRFSGRTGKIDAAREAATEETPDAEKSDEPQADETSTSPVSESAAEETAGETVSDEAASDETASTETVEEKSEEVKPPPKKRTTRGGRRYKNASAETDAEADAEEKPETEPAKEEDSQPAQNQDKPADDATNKAEAPAKKPRARRPLRKKATTAAEEQPSDETPAEIVDDATEEKPKPTRRRRTTRKKTEENTEA